MRNILNRAVISGGRFIKRAVDRFIYPLDFSNEDVALCRSVRRFTMTSPERIIALRDAVRYVVNRGIEGDFVECGVWRGGSAMMMAKTLLDLGDLRHLFLYDTFEGMSTPTENDVTFEGRSAAEILQSTRKNDSADNCWCIAGVEDVQNNILSTGYPQDQLHLIKGKVEDTIPAVCPERIALLRLDTDWYESTKHELQHLYPRLSPSGVLILDDYGFWKGARKAVDEYFAGSNIFLHRIDNTGRLIIKSADLGSTLKWPVAHCP